MDTLISFGLLQVGVTSLVIVTLSLFLLWFGQRLKVIENNLKVLEDNQKAFESRLQGIETKLDLLLSR